MQFKTLLVTYKGTINALPSGLQNMFTEYNNTYNTRSSMKGNFYIKLCSSKIRYFNISNIGVTLWNNLNENIRTSSANLFKKKVKNMFINSYSDLCVLYLLTYQYYLS